MHALVWALMISLLAVALVRSEFGIRTLFGSGPSFVHFFSRLYPPDWSVTELVLRSTFETLMIAFAGTFLAFIVSLPLGFLAATNIAPWYVSQPIKWLFGFIRSMPLIVVALIFVAAVGLGAFPGVLAVAFHSIGMLGKFYAEEFETADPGIVSAVDGSGATRLQTIRFGLFPQCVPQVVAFTVYRLEMNFRDAAVLGLVGAGGIGYYIQVYFRAYQYPKAAVLLVAIIAVVTLLDQFTFWVRRWVS